MPALFLAGVGGSDNVRMLQLANRFHLAFETLDRCFVLHAVGGQDLQCNNLVQLGMQCLVDGAHAAFAQLGQKPVIPDGPQIVRFVDRSHGHLSGREGRLAPDGFDHLDQSLTVRLFLERIGLRGLAQTADEIVGRGFQVADRLFTTGALLDMIGDLFRLFVGKRGKYKS